MEKKFTKGEWLVSNEHNFAYENDIVSCEGVRVASVKSFPKSDIFNDATEEERKYNSELIACAPLLLDWLIELHSNIKEDSAIYRSSLKCEAVDNLIKKALGNE